MATPPRSGPKPAGHLGSNRYTTFDKKHQPVSMSSARQSGRRGRTGTGHGAQAAKKVGMADGVGVASGQQTGRKRRFGGYRRYQMAASIDKMLAWRELLRTWWQLTGLLCRCRRIAVPYPRLRAKQVARRTCANLDAPSGLGAVNATGRSCNVEPSDPNGGSVTTLRAA